jgi:hypothetical protein
MRISLLFVATTLLISSGLQAEEPVEKKKLHPLMGDRHTFILGVYNQDADAEFYADAGDIGGGSVNLGDLGMNEDYTSGMVEYRFRLNDKWLFSVGGYRFNTDGTLGVRRSFVYDGQEFEAGVTVDSKLETTTYIADAMYKVYGNEKSEIFVGGGLHIFDLSAELKGRAFVGEQEKTSSRAADDILAPLPNLRAQGFYALSPKWALVGTVGWFSLKYDDYDGSFTYIHARAAYRMTEHFGVALGYQFLDMDFSVDRSRGEAGFDIEFDGPSLHLTYSF